MIDKLDQSIYRCKLFFPKVGITVQKFDNGWVLINSNSDFLKTKALQTG